MESRNLTLPAMGSCQLREFSDEDVPSLCKLEKELNLSPWSEMDFRRSLSATHHLCFGLEKQGEWLAYLVCSQILDEAELLILGVAKHCQRRGLARTLLGYLFDDLQGRAATVFLEVRAGNHRAIAFYESQHFHQVGQRPGYYPHKGGREDALLYAISLI